MQFPDVPTVAVTDVPEPIPDRVVVLDVRERQEYAAGHIANSHHIPLMRLPDNVDQVPVDAQVLVVCKVGARSAQAVRFLRAHGRAVVNLDGGLAAWDAAGRPLEASSDTTPAIV